MLPGDIFQSLFYLKIVSTYLCIIFSLDFPSLSPLTGLNQSLYSQESSLGESLKVCLLLPQLPSK